MGRYTDPVSSLVKICTLWAGSLSLIPQQLSSQRPKAIVPVLIGVSPGLAEGKRFGGKYLNQREGISLLDYQAMPFRS